MIINQLYKNPQTFIDKVLSLKIKDWKPLSMTMINKMVIYFQKDSENIYYIYKIKKNLYASVTNLSDKNNKFELLMSDLKSQKYYDRILNYGNQD